MKVENPSNDGIYPKTFSLARGGQLAHVSETYGRHAQRETLQFSQKCTHRQSSWVSVCVWTWATPAH